MIKYNKVHQLIFTKDKVDYVVGEIDLDIIQTICQYEDEERLKMIIGNWFDGLVTTLKNCHKGKEE